ncbi:MAG: hypothetical protein KDH15_22640 [Rhodocyclaceae bacterium]|nr:hypothetical protein [Rhodocyclaceae bacterium]
MKQRLLISSLALLLAFAGATAAPPPGHPAPDDALRLMRPSGEARFAPLTRSGRVVQHMDANQYTYIEVDEAGRRTWLAAPRTPVVDGSRIRFPDGVVMGDFYSKLLKRSFDAVIFVRAVESGGI